MGEECRPRKRLGGCNQRTTGGNSQPTHPCSIIHHVGYPVWWLGWVRKVGVVCIAYSARSKGTHYLRLYGDGYHSSDQDQEGYGAESTPTM